ncbi:MAG: ABC transporter ATP-binding protein/permease [Lachnospiraceae bacterium]|nr:ABC transporter ATP-binding protein/permease [Lachnospiraceae bacterium]
MLTLRDIKKEYRVGDMTIPALKGVSIQFRKSEFVSVLGQSGCGKTTLLNIIGGLDQYTEGDLIINGVSTKKFKDSDWDSYRNHSIGFVFQSYNLIPHQSVLSNVELALTLSGVSKVERRKRAKEALEKVGLGDQLNKKPNQMSGGQMQRVAIARALVNNPDILLADEPTGALDSETSVQIMEILKEVAKDKLVIMVTHNPDLAEQYSSRIVRLLDGTLISDSDPYEEEVQTVEQTKKEKKAKKTSMSFFTALSLSFNNLLTKKGRTFMTAFAGSIGIIGIALILSVSTGVQEYIDSVQRDTLSSYPITMEAEVVDSSALLATMMGVDKDGNPKDQHELDKVYANSTMYDMVNAFTDMDTRKNNLRAFKKFLEENEEIKQYISSVQYSYDMDLSIYTKDIDGKVVKADVNELMSMMMNSFGMASTMMENMSSMMIGMNVWNEMMTGENGEIISDTVKKQYDLVHGKWPEAYNEVVILVDRNNEVSDMVLYALGLTTMDVMMDSMQDIMAGKQVAQNLGPWTYEDICNMSFRVIPSALKYQKQGNGSYVDLSATDAGLSYLFDEKGVELKVVGILRPNEDATSTSMTGAIAYTSGLTKYVMEQNAAAEILKAQLSDKTTDAISGLPFETGQEEELDLMEKVSAVKAFFAALDDSKKAELYGIIMATPSESYLMETVGAQLATMDDTALRGMLVKAFAQQMAVDAEQVQGYVTEMSAEDIQKYAYQVLAAMVTEQYAKGVQANLGTMTVEQLAGMFDMAQFTNEEYGAFYEEYLPKSYSESTYDENLKLLGYADPDSPSKINIYAETFENKDVIADLIAKYNENAKEEDVIEYTDYVALLMSSITTVINAISYVLIAFVAISLVVSSIMIGIITYISVLERTKEIGILRAIGASKKDISRVFNAETIIVGFISGAIGILVTLGFILIINVILHAVTGIPNLNAVLPPLAGVILVGISMLLTFIAGLFPAKVAAKKDPVIALRSE